MRLLYLLVFVGVCMPLAGAAMLTVYVTHEGGPGSEVVAAAESEAAGLLGDAGVEITRLNCDLGKPSPACGAVPGANDVILRLVSRSGERSAFGAEVLGRSIGGMFVDVYCSVADRIAKARMIPAYFVYALAISHELGRLLLGREHAKTGLMQAFWGNADFDAAVNRRLRFSAEECGRIRAGELLRFRNGHQAKGKRTSA
jgi:hypothetical protein